MLDERENELELTHVTDDRLAAYESFFDHGWAQAFARATDASTLPDAGFCLIRDWKGAALVARMPWLMVYSLKNFHSGFTQTNRPFWERLAAAFGEYVVKDTGLSNMRKKEVLAKVKELSEQVQEDMRRVGPPLDPEAIWREFLQIDEFRLSLWNSQRICYGATYYAYENFLQRCIALGKADQNYKSSRLDKLGKDFAECFGAQLCDECLKHPDVEIARLARNDLTHNGGRVTNTELEKSPLTIKKGYIHIMPGDVRNLFDVLKALALKIAERAKSLPAYSRE